MSAAFVTPGWREKLRRAAIPEAVAVAIGLVAGVLAATLAVLLISRDTIDGGFYGALAQINPVFLVALAVEQRLIDRLGGGQRQYADAAVHALGLAIDAYQNYEDGDHATAYRLQAEVDADPSTSWVWAYVDDALNAPPEEQPDIREIARRRYARRRATQAIYLMFVIAVLIVGEITALAGMAEGGTSRCSPVFAIAVGTAVAAFTTLAVSALSELIGNTRPAENAEA